MKLLKRLISNYKDRKLKKMFPSLKQPFLVKSHLTLEEKSCLYLLAKNRECILEIGSYLGASACCFGAALQETGFGKLICIDTWNNDSMSEGIFDTWQDFMDNTHAYRKYITALRGFSADIAKELSGKLKHVDVLFLDADHSYRGVKEDWEAYKCFLHPGSIVIFHDYGWADGVIRVVHEDVIPFVSNHDRLPNMWWGIIGP